jgi:hypothetical protein
VDDHHPVAGEAVINAEVVDDKYRPEGREVDIRRASSIDSRET